MRTIYFDMDGTIANLYSVENWLPKLRASDPSPYEEAAPLVDMAELAEVCKALQAAGYRIGVISWLSKESSAEYNRAVRNAKRKWLKKHFNIDLDELHIVKYGYSKRRVAGSAGDLLIDDEAQNVETWQGKKKDRAAINCRGKNDEIIERLRELLG